MHCKLTPNFGLKTSNIFKKTIQETSHFGNVIYIMYTEYFCFLIEMASSAGELKELLMHVVNVISWQVLPNNSSSLHHMSLVTPFQQLISPAGQLGGAQKTIVMASVLSSSKNKMKMTKMARWTPTVWFICLIKRCLRRFELILSQTWFLRPRLTDGDQL